MISCSNWSRRSKRLPHGQMMIHRLVTWSLRGLEFAKFLAMSFTNICRLWWGPYSRQPVSNHKALHQIFTFWKLVYPTDIDLLNNDKFNWSIPTRKKKKKMMDRGNMLISVVDSLLESPQLDWKRSLLHVRCLSVMPRHDLILLRVRSGADRHTLEP